MICNCNEKCLMITKIVLSKDDIPTKVELYKCNRLRIDGVKKQPCNFNKEVYIEDVLLSKIKLLNEEEYDYECKKLKVNYRNKFDKLLKTYNMYDSTNYYGKLNYYLQRLGYRAHDPPSESYEELLCRVSKKPTKIKSKIYIDKVSELSQAIGEYDYDIDDENELFDNIEKKIKPFEFTEDPYIKNILSSTKNKKVSTKNKKVSTKNNRVKLTVNKDVTNNDVTNNELLLLLLEDIDEDDEEELNISDDDDNENEEGEEVKKECVKDNEFDVENYSDDNDLDEDYEDFSD